MMTSVSDYEHDDDGDDSDDSDGDVMIISLMTVMKQMITVMLYIRSGSIWGSPQVLTAKNCFPFILSFVMIIVIISPSYHISLSFVLVIPPIQWSSGCNANKKSY